MGKIYGYVRIQFPEQDAEEQIITLREMQVPNRDIFIDRQQSDSYLEYQKLLARLKADDLLYIKSLDTLGTDYKEIGEQWRRLTKEKKADVVVLDMPYLDTRRGKTQFDTMVADIVLSMLEYAPGIEGEVRRKRQKEGIAKAKQSGVQFGRPELPLPDNFVQVYKMWRKKEVKGEQAAQMCRMSRSQFYKKARERREQEENANTMTFILEGENSGKI